MDGELHHLLALELSFYQCERDAVGVQQLEQLRARSRPAALAEFDRPAGPASGQAGEALEKRRDRVPALGTELGSELHQHGAELVAEQRRTRAKQLELRRVWGVGRGLRGQLLRQLEGEAEARRHPLRPAAHDGLWGSRVVARVHLDVVAGSAIEVEESERVPSG